MAELRNVVDPDAFYDMPDIHRDLLLAFFKSGAFNQFILGQKRSVANELAELNPFNAKDASDYFEKAKALQLVHKLWSDLENFIVGAEKAHARKIEQRLGNMT